MGGWFARRFPFSKELRLLEASTTLEDALYNFTRPIKTLRVELPNPSKQAYWQQRTPAMEASLTDHIWTVQELLTKVFHAHHHLTGRPPACITVPLLILTCLQT